MKKPVKPKRPSGAAQLRALGKIPVQVTPTAEQIELIDRACEKEGRARANFFTHYAAEKAKEILGEKGG